SSPCGAAGGPGRDRLLPERRRPLAAGAPRADARAPGRARLRAFAVVLDRPRRKDPRLARRPAPSRLPRADARGWKPDPALLWWTHAPALPAAAGRLAPGAGGNPQRPLHVAADPVRTWL